MTITDSPHRARSSFLRRHALPALMTVGLTGAVIAAGMLAGRPGDDKYYAGLRQAPFAPPPWMFGPAWVVAKLGSSATSISVLRDFSMRQRPMYMKLAALDTAIYVTFSWAYFRRKSPLLAAVWTCADAATTAGMLAVLARNKPRSTVGLAPQAAWLCLATPVAVYQAAAN